MKLLFLNSLYFPHVGGGAEITIRELATGLRNNGVDVTILSIGPSSGLSLEEIDGIRVWRAGVGNLYFHHDGKSRPALHRAMWHLLDAHKPWMRSIIRRVIGIERPDVASCHNLPGWSISAWGAIRSMSVPIVQVLHDQYLLCPKSTMFRRGQLCNVRCMTCRALRLRHPASTIDVKAVVGVSQFILDKHLKFGYFADVRIREVIRNARKIQFSGNRPERLCSADSVVFGFIGTLSESKGLDILLDAFVASAEPSWRLRIAGTGKEGLREYLQRKYEGRRDIEFLGEVSSIEFYSSVDVTVVPSRWEDTFPGVAIESIASGVPVLATAQGGIPEIVEPGVTGILVQGGLAQLKAGLIDFARDIEIWRRKSAEIAKIGRRFTDTKEWVNKWRSLYEGICSS